MKEEFKEKQDLQRGVKTGMDEVESKLSRPHTHMKKHTPKEKIYLSVGASSTMSIPIQIPAGVPIPVVVPELIHTMSVHHLFSSTSISLASTTASLISRILSVLIHFLQSDAELGKGSNHLQHTERSLCPNAHSLWHIDTKPPLKKHPFICLFTHTDSVFMPVQSNVR